MSEGAVLVTGATGFIGRELARQLLSAGRPIIALARERSGVSALERVAESLGSRPDGRRLDVVAHDLGHGSPDASTVARLRDEVEAVIHCAGDTAFVPGDASTFRAGHVEGPVALLSALAGGRLRRWTQVSTAFVCGARSGRVREDQGDVGQTFRNAYERVKLDAERDMRAAGAGAGIEVVVVRPSIVVGVAPPTAGGIPSGLFFEFIRLLGALARMARGTPVALRIPGRPRAPFNIVPVEYVTSATLALADHPDAADRVCHLVVSDAPSQQAMLAMITERLGVAGLRVVEGPLLDASPMESRLARMMAPYRPYLDQDVTFDDSTARVLLDACGVPRATLDAAAVHRLIDMAVSSPPGGRTTMEAHA